MNKVLEKLGELKLVPVVKIERASDALALGQALVAGGLPLAEITFRTDAAEGSIRILCEKLPGMFVGAGTVLNVENARKAVQAGAQFVVAPGFNPKVVDYCLEHGIPVVPGICTPTEVEMGLDRGLELLKFFPAEAYGGIKTLKALSAPYSGVKFMPTGGIGTNNVLEYLALRQVVACGGSWMAETSLIANGQFDEITRLTREAVALIVAKERV
jgi:2-dehydro-3-deoxyphosphogluconate aldolase/(4S)-4-hydroxy-2-oxoglutarate aldolase